MSLTIHKLNTRCRVAQRRGAAGVILWTKLPVGRSPGS